MNTQRGLPCLLLDIGWQVGFTVEHTSVIISQMAKWSTPRVDKRLPPGLISWRLQVRFPGWLLQSFQFLLLLRCLRNSFPVDT
jgi:hypothetical protein